MHGAVLEVGAADWPNFRFAHSALFETMQAARTLNRPERWQLHQPWLARVNREAVLARIPQLTALNPTSGPAWVPDFLAPPPPRQDGLISIDDELALVEAYPPRLVRRDVERSLASQPDARHAATLEPVLRSPTRGLRLLVAQLRIAWQELVEPFWPAITRVVGEDIGYRTRLTSRRGLGAMLNDLHPAVTSSASQVLVRPHDDVTVSLAGRGLLLIPSVFITLKTALIYEAPWPPALVYPARGVGNLWAAPASAPDALARLIGTSRARLLFDLDEARSTSVVSVRHSLSPATTSAHLNRLAAAGLVTSSRVGREVRYRRTALADALIAGGLDA